MKNLNIEYDKQEVLSLIKESILNNLSKPDSRADAFTYQTAEDEETSIVLNMIKTCGGETRYIEEGMIVALLPTKDSLYNTIENLDINDDVLEYEVQLMKTNFEGDVVDISDEIDLDDVRDMRNMFFKLTIWMNPETVTFSPYYMDDGFSVDNQGGEAGYTGGHTRYTGDANIPHVEMKEVLFESILDFDNGTYLNWKGDLGEEYYLYTYSKPTFEKTSLHEDVKVDSDLNNIDKMTLKVVVPPQIVNGDKYFDIFKYNENNIKATSSVTKHIFQSFGTIPTFTPQMVLDDDLNIDSDNKHIAKNILLYNITPENKDVKFKELKEELLNNYELNSILYTDDEVLLTEMKRKFKVDSRGKKRIKMQCRKGFKYDHHRRVCVKISGSDMMNMKRAHRQASKTKKAAGQGLKIRTLRKSRKANRFRKLMGVKPSSSI